MRLLFFKPEMDWPRSSGHDVHTFNTLRACAELGHDVSLALERPADPRALAGARIEAVYAIEDRGSGVSLDHETRLQYRFRRFFGVTEGQLASMAETVTQARPDAVIVAGLQVLPYFSVLRHVRSVWFAADELAWHHVTQMRFGAADTMSHVRNAFIKAAYERAHRTLIDRVWVVTPTERRAMRWIAGMRAVDVLPQGVDAEFYKPGTEAIAERSAVFWGRLDFGPNIQALEWFFKLVWPGVRARVPDARFTIIGFQPADEVRRLSVLPGVTLLADVPDLRSEVRRHALAVFPFVSGGGVKNKLLEAAAMAMPIVCTPLATSGLRLPSESPLAVGATPTALADQIVGLWAEGNQLRDRGAAARRWVVDNHSWTETARQAVASLERSTHRQAR